MRSPLTSGVFCIGSNLPAGQQTHRGERSQCYRIQLIRGHLVKPKYITLFRTSKIDKSIVLKEIKIRSHTYRPCLLLLSFFSKIQSRPFFTDFPFMFLNRHLHKDKIWQISLFKMHLITNRIQNSASDAKCVTCSVSLWNYEEKLQHPYVKGRKSCRTEF